MSSKSSPLPFPLRRLPEVKVTRVGDEITVELPDGVKWWETGALIDAALYREGLHPNQLKTKTPEHLPGRL